MLLVESDNEESYPTLHKVPGHFCFNFPKKVLAFTRDIKSYEGGHPGSGFELEDELSKWTQPMEPPVMIREMKETEKSQLIYYYCSWIQDYEDKFYLPGWVPSPYL